MSTPRLLSTVTVAALALAGTGCKALVDEASVAGTGSNAMLDEVAVGQNRCPDEDGEARPFVVEWDATDLAAFEAKAARDLVFVKYEGCEIEMLYGCSDNGVPGRYGAYASPTFTSGTVESFEMHDEADVYAKLPLGAARFGAEASTAQSLELQYFVSGVVSSTRNYVERAVIADNGRCAAATHFVSAYNLGAFRLLAHQQRGKSVDAVVAGGGERSESANLKNGGDLDDCDSRTQQRCRVPIRLVLQTLDESSQDLDASAAGAPRPDPEPAQDTVSERAAKLRAAAEDKGDAGDGAGCLADLDRADALDRSDEAMVDSMTLRGLCTMVAGDCKGGETILREAITLSDPDKKASNIQVEGFVGRSTMKYCPLDQLDEKGVGSAIFYRIRDARSANQPKRCDALAQSALDLIHKQRKAGKKIDSWAIDALGEGTDCLWSRGDCERAKHWSVTQWVEIKHGKEPEADSRKYAQEVWTRRHDETGCSN